ncbi:hypothetical protein UCRPC4_g04658 [Phaeomoniella chlamydospora]|uniref:Uncharacterized protein n=1 Tax=Phaeomoniella chlamydospora TaxID=158046 RepID=A0A0G2E9C9_PHACM|nr:hypothetical protein UCRPC4_g04658 [Phaeomoniella chlamydospora]
MWYNYFAAGELQLYYTGTDLFRGSELQERIQSFERGQNPVSKQSVSSHKTVNRRYSAEALIGHWEAINLIAIKLAHPKAKPRLTPYVASALLKKHLLGAVGHLTLRFSRAPWFTARSQTVRIPSPTSSRQALITTLPEVRESERLAEGGMMQDVGASSLITKGQSKPQMDRTTGSVHEGPEGKGNGNAGASLAPALQPSPAASSLSQAEASGNDNADVAPLILRSPVPGTSQPTIRVQGPSGDEVAIPVVPINSQPPILDLTGTVLNDLPSERPSLLLEHASTTALPDLARDVPENLDTTNTPALPKVNTVLPLPVPEVRVHTSHLIMRKLRWVAVRKPVLVMLLGRQLTNVTKPRLKALARPGVPLDSATSAVPSGPPTHKSKSEFY